MKQSTLLALLPFLTMSLITFLIFSCKKYPDGPNFSWTSATERVANNWKVGKALDGNTDVTSDFEKYEITFTKNYAATLSAKYKAFGITYQYVTEGTWSFGDNEKKLIVNYNDDNADKTYIILKLAEDEMWLKEEGTNLELHLIPR